jgi:Ser/Thr protein kinase RdoA (MazF antagonist)
VRVEIQAALSVLSHYGFEDPQIEQIGSGLINRTWLVSQADKRFILQRVNPMFPVEIHEDIDTVTAHLENSGFKTPRLIPTLNDKLYHQDTNATWRLYTYIEGVTYNTASDPDIALQAGSLLGQFHMALMDLDYEFKHSRAGVHDFNRHIKSLTLALEQNQQHPRYRDILPLATEVLNIAGQLPLLADTGFRKVHGDPKINNFLFAINTGQGICMLDFDTMSNMQLPLELGDAMRSWCNPVGENNTDTFFSIENFRAGLDGYCSRAKHLLEKTETDSILPATQVIYMELAARFCADALNENYFAWDTERFSSHSEHSQIRAMGQLNAYKSLSKNIAEAKRVIDRIFA